MVLVHIISGSHGADSPFKTVHTPPTPPSIASSASCVKRTPPPGVFQWLLNREVVGGRPPPNAGRTVRRRFRALAEGIPWESCPARATRCDVGAKVRFYSQPDEQVCMRANTHPHTNARPLAYTGRIARHSCTAWHTTTRTTRHYTTCHNTTRRVTTLRDMTRQFT